MLIAEPLATNSWGTGFGNVTDSLCLLNASAPREQSHLINCSSNN